MSDPGAEEALHDNISMRTFAGRDLGRAPVPDQTTICKFRHLLEKHKLGEKIFRTVNAHLTKSGVRTSTGTIVDATIVTAPSSTKNASKERDAEMHQTKKGNQWYFGMKLYINRSLSGIGPRDEASKVDIRAKSRARLRNKQIPMRISESLLSRYGEEFESNQHHGSSRQHRNL